MKGIKCEIIYNTLWGYVLTPRKFNSVRAALRDAHYEGMAFRLFIGGKMIKAGWD